MSKNQKGFTLVELLLAAAMFSFVLLFVITGFVQINRAYNRGITTKRIQQSVRAVVDDISSSLSFASADSGEISVQADRLCIGTKIRYIWVLGYVDREVVGSGYSLLRDVKFTNCNDPIVLTGGNSDEEMLDPKVAVQDISVGSLNGNPMTYSVSVTLSSNTEDLIVNPGADAACNVGSGDAYCDISTLSTIATTRN